MPNLANSQPFCAMTRDEFANAVGSYRWSRSVLRVDMHHTFRPDHARTAEIGMEAALAGMRKAHLERGFDDIAQHVTVAPDGLIWSGRDWNMDPASVGFGMNANVFMFETVGNFDIGHDELAGPQLDSVLAVIATVQRRFRLPPFSLLFHREVPQTEKTCPGTSLSKAMILERLMDLAPERRGRPTGCADEPNPLRASRL